MSNNIIWLLYSCRVMYDRNIIWLLYPCRIMSDNIIWLLCFCNIDIIWLVYSCRITSENIIWLQNYEYVRQNLPPPSAALALHSSPLQKYFLRPSVQISHAACTVPRILFSSYKYYTCTSTQTLTQKHISVIKKQNYVNFFVKLP
jgi:hypothetical protein